MRITMTQSIFRILPKDIEHIERIHMESSFVLSENDKTGLSQKNRRIHFFLIFRKVVETFLIFKFLVSN